LTFTYAFDYDYFSDVTTIWPSVKQGPVDLWSFDRESGTTGAIYASNSGAFDAETRTYDTAALELTQTSPWSEENGILYLGGDNDWFETSGAPFAAMLADDTSDILAARFADQVGQNGYDFFLKQFIPIYDAQIYGNSLLDTLSVTLTGGSKGDALPPTSSEAGVNVFTFTADDVRLSADANGVPWLNPEITVRYDHVAEGSFVERIVAPSLALAPDGDGDGDGYVLTIDRVDYALAPGGAFSVSGAGLSDVSSCAISGIDPALSLDPLDATAFATGISFV
jgi:hypothetical protein